MTLFELPGLILDPSLSLTTHTQPSTGPMLMPQNRSSICLFLYSHCYLTFPSCGTEHCAPVINPRGGFQTLLSAVSWYQNCQGKQHSQALAGAMLYSHRKNRASSAPVVGSVPPWSEWSPQSWCWAVSLPAPLCTTVEKTQNPAVEFEILKMGDVPEGQWPTHLIRTKEHSLSKKWKDILTQGDRQHRLCELFIPW